MKRTSLGVLLLVLIVNVTYAQSHMSAQRYLSRGDAQWKRGNMDRAIADYTRAIELDPNFANAYLNRGASRVIKEYFDEALADLNKAIELNPNLADAYLYRGMARSNKGRSDKALLDEALIDLNKAIELNPRSVDAYQSRGLTRERKGDFDGALADYSKTIALDPGYAEGYYSRGNVRSRRQEWGGAIGDHTRAIEINSRLAEAYNHRAWPYLILNRNDLADRDAATYLKLKGANGEGSAYVVLIAHFAKRKTQDAKADAILKEWAARFNPSAWPVPVIRYLRREITEQELLGAATDNEQTTEARAYLGMSLLLSGQREAALTHLRWVREKGVDTLYEYSWVLNELRHLEARP